MSAEMGPNYAAHSSDSGKSYIIVDSAAYPIHCPTPASGMIHNNKDFKFTATNHPARITHSGLLGIDSTQGDNKTKVVCVPERKNTLLSVRELTTNDRAVIFRNEQA